MALEDDVKSLGLDRCDFDDECDFCDSPEGGSWERMFVAEGVCETDYYICGKCIPARAEKFREDIDDYFSNQNTEQP